jgi:23S rRNA (pseudouridine1915-N3)-methyltransferase
MHHLTLISIGRLKSPWAAEGCEDYIARLRHHLKLELIELPPSRNKDAEKQRQEESEQIIHSLQRFKGEPWLLDEYGKEFTSPQFAQFIGKARDRGTPLMFILGGAYGVTDAVRSAVQGSIRLSDMTLPHELCRLLFLEQLYRACEIQKGSGYHH